MKWFDWLQDNSIKVFAIVLSIIGIGLLIYWGKL